MMIARFRETPSRMDRANFMASADAPGRGVVVEPSCPRRIRAEFSSMFERMKLGQMTLTFTPKRRASSRSDNEKPTMACLVAEYTDFPGIGIKPEKKDEVLMI